MPAPKRAILLLAHGTPDELADIPKYLSNVVSGRPMPHEVVEEITHRYGLIGKSPLTALTLEQGRLLGEAMALPVYVGMRNWKPYIADVVRGMRADGITEAVAICLAPQNSRTSVGLYRRAAFAEAAGAIRMEFIEGWADHPLLAEAFAERLAPVLAQVEQETGAPPSVLFTAHSVPCRTIQTPAAGAKPLAIGATAATSPASMPGQDQPDRTATAADTAETGRMQPDPAAPDSAPWVRSSGEVPAGGNEDGRPSYTPDPYPVEAKRTAALIAERLGLHADRWCFAFQSQGMSGGPWIGPTVEDSLTALRAGGAKSVVLQTIGFLCDHVEILYDIDIAFKEFAAELGMRLERPASLNDSPLLTAALVDLARGGFDRLNAATTPEPAEVSLVAH